MTTVQRKVLNVGGNSKKIPIPHYYQDFEHLLLDIDPKGKPDVLCDARELDQRPGDEFDAIYCSHNLEHYYWHDVARVLKGFLHSLKPGGMVDIRVPDLQAVMEAMQSKQIGLNDTLYNSAVGPIAPLDVIYGWRQEVETSGNEFFAHKTGFTQKTLRDVVKAAGLSFVFDIKTGALYEAHVIAFKGRPDPLFIERLKLPGLS